MSELRIGSLCTGYGGLDQAVQNVFGGETVWTSDIDKGACKIIAHRHPNVLNIGDMTQVDWAELEPVDILTAGYPCQPFSHAGRRKGTNDDRHLWPTVREAVRVLRPRITVLENVAGHRSLGFDRVLGDLAEDGMHVRWTSVRASDIGAPHRRERLFIVVTDPDQQGRGGIGGLEPLGRDADRRDRANGPRAASEPAALLPSPRTSDTNGPGAHGDGGLDLRTAVTMLPTPTSRDHKGHNQRRDETCLTGAIEAQRLLPTPSVADVTGGRKARSGDRNTELLLNGIAAAQLWGDYAPAIARWEQILGRPAPAPTQTSAKGNPQLSAAFVEWLMGLPAGWVTEAPGITRNEALKALGNGVVPQQAEAAIRFLIDQIEVAA